MSEPSRAAKFPLDVSSSPLGLLGPTAASQQFELQWREGVPACAASPHGYNGGAGEVNNVSEPLWVIDDQDRYDRFRLIAWWEQERLRDSRVLVVGAGALGNEVVKNLVLLGVGEVNLIDFDQIESSNLSRSVFFRDSDRGAFKAEVLAQRAGELNPDCRVRALVGNVMTDVGIGLVRRMDGVIACLDNREARLWVNRLCWKANTPWIDGGIQELNGVVKVYQPPDGVCYECTMTANDYRLIQLRYSCPLLKREDLQMGRVPTAPTIASMIGAWQVQEFLKLIHQIPTDSGSALVFNGLSNQSYKSRLPRRDDCLSHETIEATRSCPFTHRVTLKQWFRWSQDELGQPVQLVLDRDFISRLDCSACGRQRQVDRPGMQVRHDQALCECGEVMRPCSVSIMDPEAGWDDLTLQEVGVPDWDIIRVQTADGCEHWVELTPFAEVPCPAPSATGDDALSGTERQADG